MDRHIGLIRGVNVGGKNRLAMADLRAFLESLGLSQVETYVQSGNFVFADPRDPAELEPLIEQQAVHHFGRETLYWVLAAKRWRDLIAANPFPDAAASDPARLLVYVAKGELDHERLASAAKKFQTTERFEIVVFKHPLERSRIMVKRLVGMPGDRVQVGSTILYAFMQATGMVNDHLVECWRHGECCEPP